MSLILMPPLLSESWVREVSHWMQMALYESQMEQSLNHPKIGGIGVNKGEETRRGGGRLQQPRS